MYSLLILVLKQIGQLAHCVRLGTQPPAGRAALCSPPVSLPSFINLFKTSQIIPDKATKTRGLAVLVCAPQSTEVNTEHQSPEKIDTLTKNLTKPMLTSFNLN